MARRPRSRNRLAKASTIRALQPLEQKVKRCSKCKQEKPLDEFSACRKRRDGLQAQCKTCCRENFERWYERNAAKVIARATQWRADHLERARSQLRAIVAKNPQKFRDKSAHYRREFPIQRRTIHAKSRAKTVGAPGRGITAEETADILAGSLGICAYCYRPSKPCFDHIDPLSRGGAHEPENVAVCCLACNASKRDRVLIVWLANRRRGVDDYGRPYAQARSA